MHYTAVRVHLITRSSRISEVGVTEDVPRTMMELDTCSGLADEEVSTKDSTSWGCH